ncbi:MAG TPA: hypothetical protein VFE61_21900 [Candidatus Sulfotelmatobacter sp.]|nr:hypothetical protein [Candidatus Sulfotelmatobacter sp.]
MLLPADLVGDAPAAAGWGRKIAVALVVASTVFFTLYWASPLRTVDRDFEASCQQAADDLRNLKAGGTMMSIGRGPYPEHGVGFEMGNYVSYLAGWRLVGGNVALPDSAAGADDLVGKALASKSDAVAVRALRSTKCMHGLWAEPRRGTAQQRP